MASPLLGSHRMEDKDESLRLLTTGETAELLQVSRRTLQRMINRKDLRAFKIGGQWRIDGTALARWLEELQKVEVLTNPHNKGIVMTVRRKVTLTSLAVLMLPYGIGHLALVVLLSAILNVAIESGADTSFNGILSLVTRSQTP